MSTITIDEPLVQAIMDLHAIARLVEQEIGIGALSEDIRKCADRLHERTNKEYERTDSK